MMDAILDATAATTETPITALAVVYLMTRSTVVTGPRRAQKPWSGRFRERAQLVGPGPRALPGAGASWLAGRANAEAMQVIVAERAIGVEALEQVSRVGELGIRGV